MCSFKVYREYCVTMGGLFSSQKETYERPRSSTYTTRQYSNVQSFTREDSSYRSTPERLSNTEGYRVAGLSNRGSIGTQNININERQHGIVYRELQGNTTSEGFSNRGRETQYINSSYGYPKPATSMSTTFYKTVNDLHISDWELMSNDEEVKFVDLDEDDSDYLQIRRLFLRTTRQNLITIVSIESIQNPYLMGRYMLNKLKMKKMYGKTPGEMYLFHGTRSSNVYSICENNFDWRRHGSQIGHRFGQGVSFSHVSHYASHYCDKGHRQKVMIVTKVLIANVCDGNGNMLIPPYLPYQKPLRYDTSQKPDGRVHVKYSDDEFYPAYKITFTVNNLQAYYNK